MSTHHHYTPEDDVVRCVVCKEYFIDNMEGEHGRCDKCRDQKASDANKDIRKQWAQGEVSL